MANMLKWWPCRTEEERNEILEALRKYGPSLNYNDFKVMMLLDPEIVRQALLERYRIQGTAAPLELARKLRKYLTTGVAC